MALRESAGSDTLRVTGITRDVAPLAALAGVDSVTLDSAQHGAQGQRSRVAVARSTARPMSHRILSVGNLAELLRLQAGATLDSTGVAAVTGELRVEDAAYGRVRIPEARLAGRYDSLIAVEANVAIGDSVRLIAGLARGRRCRHRSRRSCSGSTLPRVGAAGRWSSLPI